MKFDYISDPSHGWVKVPIKLLQQLNIDGKISSYSYYRAGFAYLEEDCDLSIFMAAMAAAGKIVEFRSRSCRNKQSKIRGYFCYTPHVSNNLMAKALPELMAAAHAIGNLQIIHIG